MSMLGEVQATQMYVAGQFPAHATISALRAGNLLDIAALDSDGTAVVNNSELMFALKNYKGGVSVSDVIKPGNVLFANSKSYADSVRQSYLISAIPVVANKLYTISIPISGYGSLSIENEYIKEGFYKSITGDTVENIVDGLIISLARNFSREQPQASTTTTYTKKDASTVELADNLVFEFDKTTTDGTAEISTLTFGSAATATGTLKVTLNGETVVDIPIVSGETVTASAESAVAVIDELNDYTATNSSGVVTITAINKRVEVDLASADNDTTWTAASPAAATTTPGADGTAFAIRITEKSWLPEYYVTGKKDRLFLDFKVDARFPGDVLPTVTKTVGSEGSGTGYQVRNMEYYFLGNRQDTFRGAGYPHNFTEHYDSSLTGKYHMLTIGYFDESRHDPMKSKKAIIIVLEDLTQMNLIITEVNKSLLARGIVVASVA